METTLNMNEHKFYVLTDDTGKIVAIIRTESIPPFWNKIEQAIREDLCLEKDVKVKLVSSISQNENTTIFIDVEFGGGIWVGSYELTQTAVY